MDNVNTFINPSQYFVNKQYVRSYGSVNRRRCAIQNVETTNRTKLLNGQLVSQTIIECKSLDLQQIFHEIVNNLIKISKNDFKDHFKRPSKCFGLIAVEKNIIFTECVEIVEKVVPRMFYGHYKNVQIMKKFVYMIVYTMKGEHFDLKKLIEKWDCTKQPWNDLKDITEILKSCFVWILKAVVAPSVILNFYVTVVKTDSDDNKLIYFWKNEWQKFYDQSISQMISTKILTKSHDHCCGKHIRKKLSFHDKLNKKIALREIPQLILFLKHNNDYRPIVRYKNVLTKDEKRKFKDKLFLLRVLSNKQEIKLEIKYRKLHELWQQLSTPKLYFVKTDLTNAFGSIEKDKLMGILAYRHMNFQKTEKDMQLRRKIAKLYAEFVAELRKHMLVRAGSTVYKWNKGLVQGYKYSPALSEMYYNYCDKQVFGDFLQKTEAKIKFFTRSVDDYLFITDSLDAAHNFIKCLSSYKNVNYNKTVANFPFDNVKFANEITFLGYSYNTENLQVCRANNIFTGQMCYKIAFTNAISNLNKFLENRIGQSGIQVNGHLFNLYHNNEELVWRHIFTTFCLSSNKFCTILAIVCSEKDMCQYLNLYKKKVVVKLGNSIVDTLLRNKPVTIIFRYCINHIRYLAWKAILLRAQKTPKCTVLVPLINQSLAKSNCIFGKWRDHCMRVDVDGNCTTKAIREVCRRTDLRAIMMNFNTVPNFYQFYNSKSRL